MKVKVNLRDNYTGRNINIICNVAYVDENWYFHTDFLSPSQRKKIENFFGVEHSFTYDIVKIYPSVEYIYKKLADNNEFDDFKNMTMKEIIYYIRHYYKCNKLNAEKIANLFFEFKAIKEKMYR